MNISLTDLPEEYHPAIDELTGDMRIIASGLEEKFQGMGVLIALALSEIFTGQTLYVSKIKPLARRYRDDQIRTLFNQGKTTIRELSRQWNLSQSCIAKILSKPMEVESVDIAAQVRSK